MDQHDVARMYLSVPCGDGGAIQTDRPQDNMRDSAGSSCLQGSLIPRAIRRSEISSGGAEFFFHTAFATANLGLLFFEGQTLQSNVMHSVGSDVVT